MYLQKSVRRWLSTVYALSSGQGKCGVALVRVTGSRARDVLTCMTVPSVVPQPRVAALRRIIHPLTKQGLDRGLVLWFPGPHSFTGEDSCELHIHGGVAVINAVLEALSMLPGFLPAQPGDFTKRAFYNGKLDLTSVEGLGDLIHAETEAQRKQALLQMEGALGQLYASWRQTLLHCRANIEAFIDFSEDENIEEGVVKDVELKIRTTIGEMEKHLCDNRRGERLRSGLKLAILGRPNVGKSSFMNALVQRPAAIVSPIPGTTRDVIETTLDLGGYPVILSDTAGLHQTDDIVESEGIKRAIAKSKEADIAVVIIEAEDVLKAIKQSSDWSEYINSFLTEIGALEDQDLSENCNWFTDQNVIILINKVDLIKCRQDKILLKNTLKDSGLIMSVKTGEGFDDALYKLKDVCASLCKIGTPENPTLTAARHRIHISSCLESLKLILGNELSNGHRSLSELSSSCKTSLKDSAIQKESGSHCLSTSSATPENTVQIYFEDLNNNLLQSEETLILAAHHLQKAANHLGYVTGHITTEDVLNHIFSAFCIGK